MGRDPSWSATLLPEILRSATRGLVAHREVERDETRWLIFGPKDNSSPCSASNCPSCTSTNSVALAAYQKVFDRTVSSSQLGTKVLQVPKFYANRASDLQDLSPTIHSSFVERWEFGHAELRRKTWAMLPDVIKSALVRTQCRTASRVFECVTTCSISSDFSL